MEFRITAEAAMYLMKNGYVVSREHDGVYTVWDKRGTTLFLRETLPLILQEAGYSLLPMF